MEHATEELQVVRHDEEDADQDERQQADADAADTCEAERDGAKQAHCGRPDQDRVRYAGLERPAPELVQGVRRHAERKQERQQRGAEPDGVEGRRQGGADHDVGKVPGGVRRVQQRDPVPAPAPRPGRIESRRQNVRHAGDPK